MSETKKAKADIWMPIYVGDYLADTTRLNTEQHGAYFLLMMDYWRNGPPPNDPATLAQITRLSPDAWSRASGVLSAFFEIQDGMLVHGRIDREKASAVGNKSKKATAGSNGAKAKWGDDTAATNRATRSERLASARRLATHSPVHWLALRDAIGCCAKCGCTDELVKDHIKPIYQGGSDGIENIQPLCRSCNASKGPDCTDHRPTNWRDLVAKRLGDAWQTPNPSPSPSPTPIEEQKTSLGAAAPAEVPVEPVPKKDKPADDEFERAWSLYPARDGGNPKKDALGAWNARKREGVLVVDMMAGVERYAAHVKARGKLGTEFVMQAVRFFGPSKQYAEMWSPTAAQGGQAVDQKFRPNASDYSSSTAAMQRSMAQHGMPTQEAGEITF